MDHQELEDWSRRAVQALQAICDEAQISAGNPGGEDQCQDLRILLDEHARIISGQPLWQAQLSPSTDTCIIKGL